MAPGMPGFPEATNCLSATKHGMIHVRGSQKATSTRYSQDCLFCLLDSWLSGSSLFSIFSNLSVNDVCKFWNMVDIWFNMLAALVFKVPSMSCLIRASDWTWFSRSSFTSSLVVLTDCLIFSISSCCTDILASTSDLISVCNESLNSSMRAGPETTLGVERHSLATGGHIGIFWNFESWYHTRWCLGHLERLQQTHHWCIDGLPAVLSWLQHSTMKHPKDGVLLHLPNLNLPMLWSAHLLAQTLIHASRWKANHQLRIDQPLAQACQGTMRSGLDFHALCDNEWLRMN